MSIVWTRTSWLGIKGYLLVWRPSLYRACVTSAHARMPPWRPWRSRPTAIGNSCGRTETNKEENASSVYSWPIIIGFGWFTKGFFSISNLLSPLPVKQVRWHVYLLLPYNRVLEASGCGVLWWRALGSRCKTQEFIESGSIGCSVDWSVCGCSYCEFVLVFAFFHTSNSYCQILWGRHLKK